MRNMLQIVEKNKNHIADLQKIFLEVRQKTFYWLDIENYSLTDFDHETEAEFVLVALFDNKVVGFISLWLPGNFIHHFYIDDEYQQHKIGTKLLEEAIQIMKTPITLKCLEKNFRAVEFYKNKGFVATEKGISNHGDYLLFTLHEKD
jgi:GNAT superfamily N-acetyltransferase